MHDSVKYVIIYLSPEHFRVIDKYYICFNFELC